ncbi:MAG: hypothetical protein IT440_06420 [Phycisphaeraceae bacterium]|nr:hypothetical protein [Phycisphaeraceae bacterium]
MAEVRLDRVEGTRLEVTSQGVKLTRQAYVTGLSGGSSDRLTAALHAAGMPRLGDPHPTSPTMRVSAVRAEPDGDSAAVIHIDYAGPDASTTSKPVVELGVTTQSRRTPVDRHGNAIEVSHTATGDEADRVRQGAVATVISPSATLSFTRVEAVLPLALAQRFVGTVNRAAIFGAASGQWLCTAITGQSDNGGRTFRVRYEFQFSAAGWRPTVCFTDPLTGRIPANLEPGAGIVQVDMHQPENFEELGLA